MLVLSRKAGESIHVNGPCVIHINRVQGKYVGVGLEAPQTTSIQRGELVDKDFDKCPKCGGDMNQGNPESLTTCGVCGYVIHGTT